MGTGIDSVDEQHRELIATLNKLAAALRAGTQDDKIGWMLKYLERYTHEHFAHEEKCMEAAKFVSLLQSLKGDFEQNGPSRALGLEIEAKLLAWLVFHIKGTDRQLYGYTTAIGELDIT
jgi:hemerythrin